jgi:hypothetical protein
MLISVQGTGKNQLEPDQESVLNARMLSHSFAKKILDQNRLV